VPNRFRLVPYRFVSNYSRQRDRLIYKNHLYKLIRNPL
jgi:hypothetical protein